MHTDSRACSYFTGDCDFHMRTQRRCVTGGGRATPAAVEPDPAIVAQLMSMGFGENGSKRAVIATQVVHDCTLSLAQSASPASHSLLSAYDCKADAVRIRAGLCSKEMYASEEPMTSFLRSNDSKYDAHMQNAGAEVSMEWVLAHMEDADFNDPLPVPSAADSTQPAGGASGAGGADPQSVALLSSMGFTEPQAAASLKVCQQRVT